ncbi:hypothetical protein AJ80_00902 [Polytolypa hystricis UAMH7299]|uniref:CENP-V/GFA domain-containing protein n=1 Tax=Polytolypa hystricis (strain UAMH7299) TaxID=1447883 RepID=A0A2B7YTQ2_POLH7|nr:hypothetical protein AJ80_00902 [Polytolypa hystricis UAMH7299]
MAEAAIPEAEKVTYNGSCHCKAVSFTFKIAPSIYEQDVMECSICVRNGYLLVYPNKGDIAFQGDSKKALKTYQFNTCSVDHFFCGTCGTSIGIKPVGEHPVLKDRFALNIRVIEDIDLEKVKTKKADGKNLA